MRGIRIGSRRESGLVQRLPVFQSILALLALASAVPPIAAQQVKQPQPTQTFELRIVGPEGKPVAGAEAEIRLDPRLLTATQVRRGEATRFGRKTMLKADDDGRITLDLPAEPRFLIIEIKHPGYAPYWAEWSSADHPEPVPAQFTAEVERGWTVGGVIIDSSGNPVEGARLRPRIDFKMRPGDQRQWGTGTELTTDGNGKWSFASVPESMRDVHVEISHADFKPERRSLSRSEFGVEPGQEFTAKIALNRGILVVGTVADE